MFKSSRAFISVGAAKPSREMVSKRFGEAGVGGLEEIEDRSMEIVGHLFVGQMSDSGEDDETAMLELRLQY